MAKAEVKKKGEDFVITLESGGGDEMEGRLAREEMRRRILNIMGSFFFATGALLVTGVAIKAFVREWTVLIYRLMPETPTPTMEEFLESLDPEERDAVDREIGIIMLEDPDEVQSRPMIIFCVVASLVSEIITMALLCFILVYCFRRVIRSLYDLPRQSWLLNATSALLVGLTLFYATLGLSALHRAILCKGSAPGDYPQPGFLSANDPRGNLGNFTDSENLGNSWNFTDSWNLGQDESVENAISWNKSTQSLTLHLPGIPMDLFRFSNSPLDSLDFEENEALEDGTVYYTDCGEEMSHEVSIAKLNYKETDEDVEVIKTPFIQYPRAPPSWAHGF